MNGALKPTEIDYYAKSANMIIATPPPATYERGRGDPTYVRREDSKFSPKHAPLQAFLDQRDAVVEIERARFVRAMELERAKLIQISDNQSLESKKIETSHLDLSHLGSLAIVFPCLAFVASLDSAVTLYVMLATFLISGFCFLAMHHLSREH